MYSLNKRPILCLFLSLLLSQGLLKAEENKPDYFKVSDADSHIWLYGTMHILPSGIQWLKRSLEQPLQSADAFVMELDMDNPATSKRLIRAMQSGLLSQSGNRLDEQLSADMLTTLKQALGKVIPEALVLLCQGLV